MTFPIVALWAHPRSMSTATERIMRERGDCTVLHEPFLVDYYLHRAVREMPMLDEGETKKRDYVSVREMILKASETGTVFFKDMSYYVVPRIFEDREFAATVRNVFLVRDPRRSLASYFKLDPEFTLAEAGIEAQWRHFTFLRDEIGETPLVIEAEAVADNPRAVIGRLWDHAGLDFVDHAFEWQAEKLPEDWKYVEGWHANAVASTGIRKDESDPQEIFDKAAAKAPHLRDYLAHEWGFYEKLKTVAQA